MDLVRLRTLTRKSKLGYGYYAENTVGELLDKKYYKALRYAYYCVQNINFMPDILEQLHIVGKMVIEKPGVDHEKYELSNLFAMENRRGVGKDKAKLIQYWREKRKAIRKEREASKDISQGRLQAFNHGHIGKL